MIDTDDDTDPFNSGYITPPLSPTKTTSTEGGLSPRTPISPRKTRSCVFVRDLDRIADSPFPSPSTTPTKTKFACHLTAHPIPRLLPPLYDSNLLHADNDSPVKPHAPQNSKLPISHGSSTLAHVHSRSSPSICHPSSQADILSFTSTAFHPWQGDSATKKQRQSHRRSSDSLLQKVVSRPPSGRRHSDLSHTDDDDVFIAPDSRSTDQLTESRPSSTKLYRVPLRHASSPLRPSQWVTRGSILSSPRRSQASTPDRFLAGRRPPAATRESFELNKPADRLQGEQMVHQGGRSATDVFSHRLRRSGRLNDELRGLREAHSVILGRANAARRNAYFRGASLPRSTRQISTGAVWNIGGPSAASNTVVGVPTGRGGVLGSRTNAPLYKTAFLNRADPEAELEAYERRLALAFDVDQTNRVLQHAPILHDLKNGRTTCHTKHVWRDGAWVNDTDPSLLDAPQLRDDFYCTLLAYCHTSKCLAVGLGNFVHLWSERSGVDTPESLNAAPSEGIIQEHVTSLDFSSIQGAQAILAVGRADGRISLWSSFDAEPRFDATQPKPVSCVSWRPTTVQRPSLRDRAMDVPTEELLIGDEVGHIYFYSIEWPSETQSDLFGWHGAMTLLARLTIHSQQICGLAWSPDGEFFTSGGNDNSCNLFETKKILQSDVNVASATLEVREGLHGESIYTVSNQSGSVLHLPHTAAKHRWTLNAAVKAMAFCPWQRGLIAVGGGSNDRCIHFYHTRSGSCLATIDCAAQVTSLIWSQTRREIAATFGFAQPEHPYRLAVFAWPSCEQIVAVPWWDEHRALYAVAYPGGPTSGPRTGESRGGGRARGEDGVWSRRGAEEGCIVVAASDMAIRFHEIWSDRRGSVGSEGFLGGGAAGLLGGSDILEGLHGIDGEDTVIR